MSLVQKRAESGFSLVELAVALLISGLITATFLTLIPLGGQLLKTENSKQLAQRIDQALIGYLRSHLHLPTADVDGDGNADPGQHAGWLPAKDLGLPPRTRVAYQVHAPLSVKPDNLFIPHLPDAGPGTVTSPTNALDLCRHLVAQLQTAPSLPGLSVQAGYGFLIPVSTSEIEDIEAFSNALPLPGATTESHALVQATGIGELSARLSCPDRLGRAQGAAQSAAAAHSTAQVLEFNHRFRKFDIRTQKALLQAAETGMAAASSSLAFSIFDEVMAIFLTTPSDFETGLKIGLAVGEHVNATASIAYSIFLVKMASDDLTGAQESLAAAEAAERIARTQREAANKASVEARALALALDAAGVDK